jgi:hypothetical protein
MFAKKALILLLTVIITVTAVSCQNTAGNTDVTSAENLTAPETTSEADERKSISDDLPERDFEGEMFRISTKSGTLYEIYTEEEDGEILNDALYQRNRVVEERFNVEITPLITNADDGNTHVEFVKKTILASDDAFDLAATYVFTTGPIITEGLYVNWLTMTYNDFSKPWWINGINEKFQVSNAIYAAVGDMCLSALKLTYGVFYNKKIGENQGIDDVYQTVRDGDWTIEYFIALIKNVYNDVNGDGLRDGGDLYGFTAETATNLDVYTFAFNIPIIARNEEGIPELVFNSDKTIKAVEIINRLYWDGTGSYIPSDYGEPITVFKNGGAMFTTTWLGNAFSTFRDMDDDYGILPYPKFDDSQQIYMTGAMDNYSVLGIPITAVNHEMISIITEALNAESYKSLFPVYYEQALQNKYARDTESIEMLNLLMAGRNFDFCTLFSSNITGMPWLFRSLVAGKNNDFASNYAKSEQAALAGLKKVLEAYEANA